MGRRGELLSPVTPVLVEERKWDARRETDSGRKRCRRTLITAFMNLLLLPMFPPYCRSCSMKKMLPLYPVLSSATKKAKETKKFSSAAGNRTRILWGLAQNESHIY